MKSLILINLSVNNPKISYKLAYHLSNHYNSFYFISLPIKKPAHRLSFDSGVPVLILGLRL